LRQTDIKAKRFTKRFDTKGELVEDILAERVVTDEQTGCWLWKAGQWTSGNGYEQIRFKGRGHMVHRLVYEVKVGPIDPNKVLDHTCRRRAARGNKREAA
jgi:hypothetical protein